MHTWFKALFLLLLLALGSPAARADCTYLGPYPWQDGGCITVSDLNNAIAAALAPPSSLQTGVAAANLGSAFGDVTGPWSLLKVIGLQGYGIAPTAPTNGQQLVWNSGTSQWVPTTVTSPPLTSINLLAATVPSTPSSGHFLIFMDTADSRLKVLGPNGTLTTVAFP